MNFQFQQIDGIWFIFLTVSFFSLTPLLFLYAEIIGQCAQASPLRDVGNNHYMQDWPNETAEAIDA